MQLFSKHTTADSIEGEAGTREHELIIDGREATPREYARVMAAQPYEWSEEEIQADIERHAPKPFKFWR